MATHFNKRIIAAQWVARELKTSRSAELKELILKPGNHSREALSGQLRRNNLKINLFSRMVGSGHYAHNKCSPNNKFTFRGGRQTRGARFSTRPRPCRGH